MFLTLLPLALNVVLTSADNEDDVVYDAFRTGIPSINFIYQRYAVTDCTTVSVSNPGTVLAYNLDFSRDSATAFAVEVASNHEEGAVLTQILVRLDSETAKPMATVNVTGSSGDFAEIFAPVSTPPSAGVHRVFFTFTGDVPSPIMKLQNFQFFA